MLPILYGNRESGHSYKVKLAMALLGYPYEYRAVDLDLPTERRPTDFRAVHVVLEFDRGEVPAGLYISESTIQMLSEIGAALDVDAAPSLPRDGTAS